MILSLWRLRTPSYDLSGLPLLRLDAVARIPQRIARQLEEVEGVDLALRLTLLTLLLRQIGTGVVRPLILGLAVLGLLLPRLLRHPGIWIALTVLTGVRVVGEWSLADNHAYLLCYWCFAISLALVSHSVSACLALNGRLLIGGAFALAVLWKVALSPDYLDGRFFQVILLTDTRFADFAQVVGGLSPEVLADLRAYVQGGLSDPELLPQMPARFVWLAHGMTLWTVLIEGAVALSFIWPGERGLTSLRNLFLLGFCLTTYTVVPVEGFGWLLLSMGIAQSGSAGLSTRLGYLATFAVILFCREVSWLGWLVSR